MKESSFAFWCLAAMAVLVHLKRWLAAQNIFAIAAILGGFGTALALVLPMNAGVVIEGSPAAGMIPPFHPRWDFPPFWIVIVLSSRSAARLIARTWPPPSIGALALSAALISVCGMSAQYLAVPKTLPMFAGSASPWYHMAWRWGLGFLGWAVVGLITLVLIAPWLINKRSTQESHRSSSLVIWLLPGLYFVIGLIQRGSWTGAASISVVMVVVSVTGIRAIRLEALKSLPVSPGDFQSRHPKSVHRLDDEIKSG